MNRQGSHQLQPQLLADQCGGALCRATIKVRPDLIVGLAITAMNADAAHEVW